MIKAIPLYKSTINVLRKSKNKKKFQADFCSEENESIELTSDSSFASLQVQLSNIFS